MENCKICGNKVEYTHSTKMCKRCISEYNRSRKRTKEGLANWLLCSQRQKSKERNHPPPEYNIVEFRKWLLDQPEYHVQFESWVSSGYTKKSIPSVDRIDPRLPYIIGNLQVISWEANRLKRFSDQTYVPKSDNTSGVTGVSYNDTVHKYRATIVINTQTTWLGQYDSFNDACLARWNKELEICWIDNDEYNRRVSTLL